MTSACAGVNIIIVTAGLGMLIIYRLNQCSNEEILYCFILGRHLEGEGNDRADITLASGQFQMMLDAANSAPKCKHYFIDCTLHAHDEAIVCMMILYTALCILHFVQVLACILH